MAQHWIATRPGDLDVFSFEEYDVAPPKEGEVTITVRAAGMNPADAKHVARGDAADFPKAIGYEVAGVVSAVGADTGIGSGPVAVGDEVLAFRISGGWATEGRGGAGGAGRPRWRLRRGTCSPSRHRCHSGRRPTCCSPDARPPRCCT